MSSNNYYKCDLSILIITRNEEEMIKDCIESVLAALDYAKDEGIINNYEVVLSDSASTDRTIEIARKYPLKIIQLHKDWPLSPAAGLFIGLKYCMGELVSVTAGDLIVDKEWYVHAVPIIKNDETIAGIAGYCIEEFGEENYISKSWKKASRNVPIGDIDIISSGIFRKKLVDDVGSFNPFLKAGEDRDLSYRLTNRGYKLIRIPFVESKHFYEGPHGKMTYIKNLKTLFRYSMGDGQAARHYLLKDRKVFYMFISRYISIGYITNYIWILIIINYIYLHTIIKLNYLSILLDIVIISLISLIVFIRLIKKKYTSVYETFDRIFLMITRQFGFLVGITKPIKNPAEYPTNIKVIDE